MIVAIIGFDKVDDIDRAMQKIIDESQVFLFSVAIVDDKGAAAQWGRLNGAPLIYWKKEDVEWRIVKECDYLVVKIGERSPQMLKNLVMRYKATGKHGTIERC